MKNHDSNTVIKVAIADDHALFRTGVKTSLQSRKDIQMVAEAENGMQLLNLLRHIQPDVVLLDIQMPIMDGLTATRVLRGEPALAAVPVIALTAGVLAEEREAVQAAGMTGFLAKPLDLEQMVVVLRAYLPPVE